MKRLLVVKYTPREGSRTAVLIKEIIKLAETDFEVETLDLVQDPPELLLSHNLNAYVKKHLNKIELLKEEEVHLENINRLTKQVLDSDIIVLGFPIYNFSMPAAIKAWLDSIIIAGKTFRYTEYGPEGFLNNKKLLVVNTSDGVRPFSARDYSSPYLKDMFSFMGIKNDSFKVSGLFGIKYTGIEEEKLKDFISEVKQFLEIK